jgi:HEAT repeat protein
LEATTTASELVDLLSEELDSDTRYIVINAKGRILPKQCIFSVSKARSDGEYEVWVVPRQK